MIPSNDLFQLIKSLTKQEKRYFKLFVSKYNNKHSNYLALFDAINKQSTYNENVIRKQFAKEAFVKQLHVTKNYLNKLILRSLNAFYVDRSVDSQLHEIIRHIEILYEKGLLGYLKKTLIHAKKTAYKYDKFFELLEIIRWQRILIERNTKALNDYSYKEMIANLHEEEKMILKKISNEADYWTLNANISTLKRREGIVRSKMGLKKLRNYMQHPLLKNENKAISYEAKYLFYLAHSNYLHTINGNYAMRYRCSKQLIKLVDAYPDLSAKYANRHILIALTNFIIAQTQLKKYDGALESINKLRSVKPNSITAQVRIFNVSYINELNIYIKTAQFEKGFNILKQVEQSLDQYQNIISNNNKLTLYYNSAYICFGVNNYSKAIQWLNKIINNTVHEGREDIYCFARILNLIIHFERKNYSLLKYITKSTYRYLNKKNKLFKIETILLNFIRDSHKIKNNDQLINAFKFLKKELIPISKDPFEKKAFEYFDFISWFESKIENKNFGEIVKRKFKKER